MPKKKKDPKAYAECVRRREYWKEEKSYSGNQKEFEHAYEEYMKACRECEEFE